MCWSRAFLYQVQAALIGCILADAALDTWAIGAAAPPAGEVYLCSCFCWSPCRYRSHQLGHIGGIHFKSYSSREGRTCGKEITGLVEGTFLMLS